MLNTSQVFFPNDLPSAICVQVNRSVNDCCLRGDSYPDCLGRKWNLATEGTKKTGFSKVIIQNWEIAGRSPKILSMLLNIKVRTAGNISPHEIKNEATVYTGL